MWSFLIGDGCVNESKIRAYNTEPQPLTYFVELLRDYGYNSPNVYVAVPKFIDDSQLQHFSKKWAEILRVPLGSIRVRKEHERYEDGHLVESDKECVEVSCFSDTLAWIFSRLVVLAEKALPNLLDFQKAYLQGIFSAEGSVVYRKKNGYRAVLIDMKNEREIKRIAEFLNNFGVTVHDPRKSNGAWYVHVTNRQNLEKLAELDIFVLHPPRKRKLEDILKKYKRRQTIACKKNVRFLQIAEALAPGAKQPKRYPSVLVLPWPEHKFCSNGGTIEVCGRERG